MSVKVKICGLTDVREAEYLNRNNVDYAGMVLFFEKSKRNITIDKAKEIMAALDSNIKKVAVVVTPTVEQVMEICDAGFDIIQIHGAMTDEVYDLCNIDIWKAFNLKDMAKYDDIKDKSKITGFVFDSAEPGSGKAYDHNVLDGIERIEGKLFVLAGGLNPDNVAEAIAEVCPDVVDCSSGVEYGRDIVGKDPERVDEFVKAAR